MDLLSIVDVIIGIVCIAGFFTDEAHTESLMHWVIFTYLHTKRIARLA